MTPQEKAYELVGKYLTTDTHDEDSFSIRKHRAIRCALIAVNEIIEDHKQSLEIAKDLHIHARGLIIGSLVNWQEVKREIEKL